MLCMWIPPGYLRWELTRDCVSNKKCSYFLLIMLPNYPLHRIPNEAVNIAFSMLCDLYNYAKY